MKLVNSKKAKNIQQRGFAGRHRPNYWSAPYRLDYGRADGIPYFPVGMVVCASSSVSSKYIGISKDNKLRPRSEQSFELQFEQPSLQPL